MTVLDPNRDVSAEMRGMFSKLSEAKEAALVFVGLQVRRMLSSEPLWRTVKLVEEWAWNASKNAVRGFLGNIRTDNYEDLISELVESYRSMGWKMSLKLHYLHSHIEFFLPNLGAVSGQQGCVGKA